MALGLSQHQQLRQQQRMIPEQILSGELLQLPLLELERRLEEEYEKNPALTLETTPSCPACGASTTRFPCPACGHRPVPREEIPVTQAEDWESYRQGVHDFDGEDREAFAGIAARRSFHDHLMGQWASEGPGAEGPVGAYLIECLSDDGYLTEPLLEIADRYLLSVPQVEAILRRVQALEPAGVGARNLQECLLLQVPRAEGMEDVRELARRVLTEGWDLLTTGKTERLPRALQAEAEATEVAVAWIRDNLAPYPGRGYRDDWESLAPLREPRVAPDVIIRHGPDGFLVEIVESSRFRLGLDSAYTRLHRAYDSMNGAAPAEAEHVRRAVGSARLLIEAMEQRRRTLHRVMSTVANAQAEFLHKGRAHLKPLLQKAIAVEVGCHESTVSRALAHKHVRLPSGETIPADRFFETAAAVKEALAEFVAKEDPAKPLSDSRLAQLLNDAGHPLARRTVAKYREALHIPTVELRARRG